ncbi:DUF3267 domain-containing protein [Butyrivibrio sp. AE2032]|uniref:DUF3267 domain-containing protein n=1 Tax=Butyrivibrio sp. AE2032 TaxID=1458463 RepID=UPI000556B647|nr:DUF3267 domain-containing protein [Butyrivibrio sp. AE2032]
MGKLEEKEKHIKLTPAEERRQAHFEKIAADLQDKGYKRTNLTIGVIKANVVTILIAVPLIILAVILFFVIHPDYNVFDNAMMAKPFFPLLIAVVLLVLIALHEFIHGLTWSLFCENGFKDIEYGIKWQVLTPYCTCSTPLKKNHYILGALMPLIILGIIPTVVGMIVGSMLILLIGLMMIIAAGGDMLIVHGLLKYKSSSSDLVIFDHPSMPGSIVFEK